MSASREATNLRLRLVQIRMRLLSGNVRAEPEEAKLLAELDTIKAQLDQLGQPAAEALLTGAVPEGDGREPPGLDRGGGPVVPVRVRAKIPVRCWMPTPLTAARCDITDVSSWPTPGAEDWKRAAKGDSLDLSASGMLFETDSVVIVGTPAWLELGESDEAVQTRAILVRAERIAGACYRVGIQFIEPGPDVAAAVARWMEESRKAR